MMPEKRVYTVAEVAALLGVQKNTVHLALKRGELPHFTFGGKILVNKEAVDKLLSGGSQCRS